RNFRGRPRASWHRDVATGAGARAADVGASAEAARGEPTMTCRDVERELEAYVDGELEPESARALHDHLDECAACRRRVSERQALGRLVRSAPYYTAPDRLRARVLAQAGRPRSMRRTLTWAAAAVVVVSAGSGIALLRSSATRSDLMAAEVVGNHVR